MHLGSSKALPGQMMVPTTRATMRPLPDEEGLRGAPVRLKGGGQESATAPTCVFLFTGEGAHSAGVPRTARPSMIH